MITGYVRRGQHALRQWVLDPRVLSLARGGLHMLAGFCLSAASLEQGMLPLVLGLVWACRGWRAVLVAGGGILGYGIFWETAGFQGMVWTGLALAGVLLLGDRRILREAPLLVPAMGMLMVSAAGLGFQLLAADDTSIPLYLIRVALGGAAPWLFSRWMQNKDPLLEWLCWGLFTLGLAQILPVPWLGLGYVAAGFTAVRCAFPMTALTGLALDLAGITPIPMTAVTVLAWLVRFLPRYPKWVGSLAPGTVAVVLMQVWGQWDLAVLPGLFLGGITACFFMARPQPPVPRRGQTGVAQVQLEMAAGVLNQTAGLLAQVTERVIDTDALARRAGEEACTGCSARDRCRDVRRMAQLPGSLLRAPLLTVEELPVRCRKGSRVLAELRRAQQQFRSLEADRQRQSEYREALIQQYDFLGSFLRSLSDRLSGESWGQRQFDPAVSVYGSRSMAANGDRCLSFPGTGNLYYIVLCDGMGTGPGAVQEGRTAGSLLHRLLSCGFPAEHALESLNSLFALRERAASVTVDLVRAELDTGKVTLYKWGAAPSWLVSGSGAEKLGRISPPPGLYAGDRGQACCSFRLNTDQVLLLVSDGLEEAQVHARCKGTKPASPAFLAEELIRNASPEDDATVVTIQLVPVRR